jgi:hypothetical protein
MNSYEMQVLKDASADFIKSGEDLFTKDNLTFISKATTGVSDPGFKMMLNNTGKFDAVLGKGKANQQLVALIMREDVFPKVFAPTFKNEWASLSKSVSAKYPAQATEALLTAKIYYYQQTKDWKNFQANIVGFMNKYGANVEAPTLNEFAWAVFENCPDVNCVKEALAWSKRSFEKGNQPEFIDTYANLLYKMGKKKEAIEWETKALALAGEGDKEMYQQTIDKMKKGEKTWND